MFLEYLDSSGSLYILDLFGDAYFYIDSSSIGKELATTEITASIISSSYAETSSYATTTVYSITSSYVQTSSYSDFALNSEYSISSYYHLIPSVHLYPKQRVF